MLMITHPKRPARAGEWTKGTAIMFIVTLAATGSVTLAARAAGMSRKSAYALRKRDTLFAASWQAAKKAAVRPPEGPAEGDTGSRATRSISSSGQHLPAPRVVNSGPMPAWRNSLHAELRLVRESHRARALAALAGRATPQ